MPCISSAKWRAEERPNQYALRRRRNLEQGIAGDLRRRFPGARILSNDGLVTLLYRLTTDFRRFCYPVGYPQLRCSKSCRQNADLPPFGT